MIEEEIKVLEETPESLINIEDESEDTINVNEESFNITNAVWGQITGTLSDQIDLQNALNEKQDTLVSGENIKTINNESILGGGNIEIEANSYYDASWVLTQAQATPQQYNELLEASNNNQQIIVKSGTEHYYIPEITADANNIVMALSLSTPNNSSVNIVAFEVSISSDTYNIVFSQGTFNGNEVISALNLKANRKELATVAFTGNYSSLNDAPSVNDGVLTLTENGSTIGTFSANSSMNETINISTPTSTSELTNNSGFITSADTYYDASYLFEAQTVTQTQYNELVEAITNHRRIYLSQANENYDALGRIYDEATGNITLTITVGSTDNYDGNTYAYDIVALFEINGTTKAVTTTVGSINGAEIAHDIDTLNASLSNKPNLDTDQLENYYTKPINNSIGGIMMPDTTNMTPIKTIEYDVSSNAYFTFVNIPNTFNDLNEVNGEALFRITVTGDDLAVNVIEALFSLRQSTNFQPFLIVRNRPGIGANAAADSGIRYMRYVYPKALNNGYDWELDFNCINANDRHIKIEVFNETSNVNWKQSLTQSDYNSTYQSAASLTLSTVDGIMAVGNFQFSVSSATNATYLTSYLGKFLSGTLPHAGQAISAQQFIFLSDDNKFYPSSNKTKPIKTGVGLQLCSNNVNLNSAVPNSGLRQKYNNATLTNIPHATLTAGDECWFRCTMDAQGNILSDNYVDTQMSAGYTWYFVGIATSSTAINTDTTQSKFYTLDANGKLTHIDGLEIA